MGETCSIKSPDKFLEEPAWMATQKRVPVWAYDKIMGRCASIFPLHRRFFSISYACYQLLAYLRQKLENGTIKETEKVHLNRVRRELEAVWDPGCCPNIWWQTL